MKYLLITPLLLFFGSVGFTQSHHKVTVQVTPAPCKEVLHLELNQPQLQIFPNPASSNITLTIQELSENSMLRIYSVTGQLWYTAILQNSTAYLDISSFANGLYLVHISSGAKVFHSEFIVKR